MTLSFETHHEYYFKDPTMFYCDEHNVLCVSENYEDTLRISGFTSESIVKFVNGLIKHHPELAASFEEVKQVDTKTTRNKKTQSPIKSVA